MEPGAWWDVLRLKLRAVFRKDRADLELREELQSHLEHQIDEHVARGVPRDQARTLALRHLSRALEIDANYRDLIADEADFNPLRHDPEFRQLAGVGV